MESKLDEEGFSTVPVQGSQFKVREIRLNPIFEFKPFSKLINRFPTGSDAYVLLVMELMELSCFLLLPFLTLKLYEKNRFSSADDLTENRKVAIKKIHNAFEDMTDSKRLLREIKLMRHLQHENVSRLLSVVFIHFVFFKFAFW